MKDYFDQLKRKLKHKPQNNSYAFVADNVDEFVSILLNESSGELDGYYIKEFIDLMKSGSSSLKDTQNSASNDSLVDDFLYKLDGASISLFGAAPEELKVLLFSNLNNNPQQQQNYAANKVLDFCKKLPTKKSYGSSEIAKLGDDIALILSPLAKGDKKTIKFIKDNTDILARGAISIMSETNADMQLKGWQKFLHSTVDRFKGIFADAKIQHIIRGKAYGNITQVIKNNQGQESSSLLPPQDKKKDSSIKR